MKNVFKILCVFVFSMLILSLSVIAQDVVVTPEKVAWYVIFVKYMMANKDVFVAAILALLAFAEVVVRLTPTKTDDGVVERIGSVIKKILDFLGFPNNKSGGGTH